jgi:site-specific DNA-cytosine methylase
MTCDNLVKPRITKEEIKNIILGGGQNFLSRERSYLQTFPDNFIFAGSKTDLEQMIGNAVPVKLAEYVAKCLLMYIQDKDKYHISDVSLLIV